MRKILDKIKNVEILSPDALMDRAKKWFSREDKLAILMVMIFGLINNFALMITQGEAPDATSPVYFHIAGNWEISLGRFGIQYVDQARFGFVYKFLIILVCLTCLALAAVLIRKTFNIKKKVAIVLMAILIAVAPTFTETYMFVYCADSYCLAFSLSALAIYLLTRQKKINYLFAVICTIAACSLYQAYLGVLFGLLVIYPIKMLLNNKDIKRAVFWFLRSGLILALGVVAYYIILKIVVAAIGIDLATYKGANGLGISTLTSAPQSIKHCFKDFIDFFMGNNIIKNAFYNRGKLYMTLLVTLGGAMGITYFSKKSEYKNKIWRLVVILLLCLCLPIAIGVMNVVAVGTRLNLVTCPGMVTVVVLGAILYEHLAEERRNLVQILKYPAVWAAGTLAITFVISNTFTALCRQQTFDHHKMVLNDIYLRAVEMEDYTSKTKWMFDDIIKYSVPDRERANGFISNDNQTWNNYAGTLQNRSFYIKHMGVKINMASRDEYDAIMDSDEYKEMPTYPSAGSVKMIDDILVIKVKETKKE